MRILSMGLLLALAAPAFAAESIDAVMSCVRGNIPQAIRVQQLELITVGLAGEESVFRGRAFAAGDKKADGSQVIKGMLRLDEPANLNGAAYLVRDAARYESDGMFVFLPAVGRVRRISGSFGDGRLFGSNISYFDFKQLAGAFGDFDGELESTEELADRRVHIVRFRPAEGADTPYTAVRAWIDAATCLPLQADFLEDGVSRKRMTAPASGISKIGDQWYLSQMQMQDMLDGTKTIMKVAQMLTSEELSSRHFDPQHFHEVR